MHKIGIVRSVIFGIPYVFVIGMGITLRVTGSAMENVTFGSGNALTLTSHA